MQNPESSRSAGLRRRVVSAIKLTRLISVLAVLSSLVGALLMFWIGTTNTIQAILLVVGRSEAMVEGSRIEPSELVTIELLECLDHFLVGLVFLYFAYGIYALFLQPEEDDAETPHWLRVTNIGTLKKTLLEVLVVLLTVIFVKGLLERLSFRALEWTYLVIPLSIVAIALSTRLLQFETETEVPESPPETD